MTDTKTKDEFSLEEDDLFEDFDIVGTLPCAGFGTEVLCTYTAAAGLCRRGCVRQQLARNSARFRFRCCWNPSTLDAPISRGCKSGNADAEYQPGEKEPEDVLWEPEWDDEGNDGEFLKIIKEELQKSASKK